MYIIQPAGHKQRKALMFSAAAVSVAFVVGACSPAPQQAEPIRIGATMSETGAYNVQGRAAKRGYELCAEHLNDQGGILGRQVDYVVYDDASDTEQAIERYQYLVQSGNYDLVMGPYGSTLTEAVAPVTEQAGKVLISPLGATTSIWEQGREYLFMVLPPAEVFLAGLVHMADAHGLSRIAVISESALFPEAVRSGAVELAEELDMNVLLDESYPAGTEDFAGLARRMGELQVEVVAMAASTLSNFSSMIEALDQEGIEVRMFGTSGAVQEFHDQLGDKANGVFGLSAWEPQIPIPGAAEFAQSFQDEYGIAPSFHAAGGYGSCMLFAEAIEKAGSLNDDVIRDVLLNLKTTTIFGPFEVDERGYQIANQGVMIQWRNGQKVIVWPEAVAEQAPVIND